MARSRHGVGATKRDTHHTSPIDFAQPSDRLYGSEMDLEPVSGVDLGAGSVTDGSIVEGGLDGSTAIKPGTLPPVEVDTTKPPVPLIISVTSASQVNEAGQSATGITAVVGYPTPPGPPDRTGLDDLHQYASQITRFPQGADPSLADWTRGQQRVTTSEDETGTLDTTINHPSVTPSIRYWLRVAAIDRLGNQSDWSLEESFETEGDLVGPPQLTGLVTEPGMGVIGVRWDMPPVADLAYVEVRWREKVDVTAWVYGRVFGSILVITGVTNDVVYEVQARSVDSSGNVHTGTVDIAGDAIYAKAASEDEVGWVAGADVTPVAVGAETLVWNKALLGEVWAGIIDADWITSGTLRAGNPPDDLPHETDVQIEVWTSFGKLAGRWSTAGIELFNPPDPGIAGSGNPGYKMLLNEAGLVIYTDFGGPDQTKVVTLSPLGIDAASVTFGSMRGGHNLVQNSSFELGAFAASAIYNHTWDVAADWNTSRNATDVNVTTDTTSLRMTLIT